MFTPPPRGRYELVFRLFGVIVRVHPTFWLICILLCDQEAYHNFTWIGLWVVAVFLSVLLHEMGHVLAGRIFGTRGFIVLYGLGGMAVRSANVAESWKRMFIVLAGPAAGILVALWIDWLIQHFPALSQYENLGRFLWYLYALNWYWSLFNLLPVLPLDGGLIARNLLGMFCSENQSLMISLWISIIFSVCLITNSVLVNFQITLIPKLPTHPVMVVLFISLLWSNVMGLRQMMQVSRGR